jgi:hypothetical protein
LERNQAVRVEVSAGVNARGDFLAALMRAQESRTGFAVHRAVLERHREHPRQARLGRLRRTRAVALGDRPHGTTHHTGGHLAQPQIAECRNDLIAHHRPVRPLGAGRPAAQGVEPQPSQPRYVRRRADPPRSGRHLPVGQFNLQSAHRGRTEGSVLRHATDAAVIVPEPDPCLGLSLGFETNSILPAVPIGIERALITRFTRIRDDHRVERPPDAVLLPRGRTVGVERARLASPASPRCKLSLSAARRTFGHRWQCCCRSRKYAMSKYVGCSLFLADHEEVAVA